jgi:mannitol 2-dehydrogenase
VKIPQYDRKEITPGIFHFGVGNFHRAHQALIMDDLFSKGCAKNFGIVGVGVLEQDERMRDVLKEQDFLYTVVEKPPTNDFNYRVIGSIIDYIFAPDDVNALIEKLCSNDAKIISLTITEGGYNTNVTTGEFDLEKVKYDLNNLSAPKTVFGIVVEALRRRKERGLKGFTIMSCDNLQGNGKIAKEAFGSFAKAIDLSLHQWIMNNVSFPNTMVDRITPVTSDDDRTSVARTLGMIDNWPVCCEDFIHWVIEDDFVSDRPDFEKNPVVQIVVNVEPYELMKLRLINAGHQLIAYFGLLLDYSFVHDVTQNQLVVDYLNAYMDREATSTLQEVRGVDLKMYKAKIVERFQNCNVLDTLARLAFDGSDRIFKFVIPVIIDRLRMNQSIFLSTAVVASYAKYLDGKSESGKDIKIVDRSKKQLMQMVKKLQSNAAQIAEQVDIFGEVVDNEKFVSVFTEIYDKINRDGSENTLKWLTDMK